MKIKRAAQSESKLVNKDGEDWSPGKNKQQASTLKKSE
jgi:hypothetical protein